MTIYIKNMVCDRCISAVRTTFIDTSIHVDNIRLGEVEMAASPSTEQLAKLSAKLSEQGFELIDDRKSRIIEKIKNIAITLVRGTEETNRLKISELIAAELHYDYPYLSNLFSETEGITIEQYLIRQKVERIKEFIVYDELSLSEISDQMGYSSVAHLSAQFKKITGMTPSQFKKLDRKDRKALDKVNN